MLGTTHICSTPKYAAHSQLLQWIAQREFVAYQKSDYQFGPATSARVAVYHFHLPCIDKEVVMKVSSISSQYPWSRKWELWLRRLIFNDHNATAFAACEALQKLGFPVAQAITLWSDGKGFARKTYFLYEKLEKNSNAETLMHELQKADDDNALQCADALLIKMFSMIADIHRHAWRHGDPVPKNFLLDVNKPAATLNTEDIENIQLYLIDYDRSRRARVTMPFLKKLFDLKDLRGFVRFGYTADRILQAYGSGKSPFWKQVLIFWIKRRHTYVHGSSAQ